MLALGAQHGRRHCHGTPAALWRRRVLAGAVERSFCDARRDPRDAVVKVFSARQRPGWTVPWQMQPVESSTGSGAVIFRSGGRTPLVLTAAHVVADARHLQVQRSMDRFSSEKIRARVVAVCHEVDLALLSVDEPEAFDEIAPLELGPLDSLPRIFDKVHVVGYPLGGDAVSVTEGVVSRVEVQEYSHSLRAGLALTVDAAINSGNSGGPVLSADTSSIVGVAFQKLVARGVELQGHAVPAPMIHRFLAEVELAERSGDGDAVGSILELRMPSLGCDYQSLEPVALRRALGLSSSCHGILISRLHYSGVAPELCVDDVMVAFNGLAIDDLGFCDLLGQRLHFAAARDLCRTHSVVPLTVLRRGEELVIQHRLLPTQHFVPRGQYDSVPRFFACGGLVFQPVSYEFLQGWNANERPTHLQELYVGGHVTPERTEAVMLSQVLADEANVGYDSGWVGAPIVRAMNGEQVRDLAHLVRMVRGARAAAATQAAGSETEMFLRFDLDMATGPFRVVLSASGLDQADKRVHSIYGVPATGCSEHYVDM